MGKQANVDADSRGAITGSAMTLTTEKQITLYVIPVSGAHNNHRIGLEISPDGNKWLLLPQSILGLGFITVQHVAAQIRASIIDEEEDDSVVDIHLLAR